MDSVMKLEDLLELQRQMDEINKLDILTVQLTHNGQPVVIPQERREEMRFMGLSTFHLLKDFAVVDPTAV